MELKSNKAQIAKLLTALTVLAGAVTAYLQVRTQTLELEKQNAVAYQALAEKVNAMAEKLAYLDGRVSGMTESAAKEMAREKTRVIVRHVSPAMAVPDRDPDGIVIPEPAPAYAPLPVEIQKLVEQKASF